jgi:putative membrane protein
VSAVAGSTAAGTAAWRRLSTRMLLGFPVLELIRALPGLLGLVVAGSSSGHGGAWGLAGVGVTIAIGTLRWATTTYRITAEQVQIRRGLLRRRLVSVSRDRVRTVDVTSHALHRVLGLARVTVGTGRSDRGDDGRLRLDGLSVADAATLRDELLHRPEARPAGEAAPEAELARLRPGWIAYGPFTLSGVLAIGVLAAFASHVASEAHVDVGRLGPLRAALDQLSGTALAAAIAEVAVGSVVVVAVASTIGYVLAFWGFRLTRNPRGTLHVTRGLVTTRATTIEERRLRGVELSEPLLLRAVRGGRCIAIATGLRVGRGAERGGSLLLPPAPRAEAERVSAAVLGGEEPVRCPLAAHGPPARRRRVTRALSGAALLVASLGAAALAAGWSPWAWGASVLAIPAAALLAADRYRSLGHALPGGTLVTRTGSLVRRRSMLDCDGVIGFNLRRSFFQRRVGLLTLTATTAAGRQRYAIQDVEPAEALRVAEAAAPGLLAPFLEPPLRPGL